MEILDKPKFQTELTTMFRNRWGDCLNRHMTPMIIEDIIKFIEHYDNIRIGDRYEN